MTADLARTTYDPTRHYRSVISQQGRVTLEADSNEAALIAAEALRLETLDIIGPTGTPDDGYKVGSGSGATGISVGPGTMYLGGWRLELDASVDLAKQPDWLDRQAATLTGDIAVALLVTEQSVCAVEDQALREVALGGPDSAARSRLMQHFLQGRIDGETCALGAAGIKALLNADGLTLDPASCEIVSSAGLQAGFVPGPNKADPCKPAAAGGYLGADNQLVRVTVVAYDATVQNGTLLWGWNNASLLYRAAATDARTLTLSSVPVDEEHAPQAQQAVEILRSQANLGDGNFIAAPEGFVTTLAQGYSFDTGVILLADALPPLYQSDTNPLFVRLWQATVPFNAGQATPLDATSGITVAITLPALPSHIGLRPFWRFAVRPSTPVQIWPQRYQDAPQSPEGPRQWLTDLAVVRRTESGATVLADCRIPFKPLTVHDGGCCSLVLGPADVAARGGLQAVMDSLAGTKSSVSLRAGRYNLPAPLVLTRTHAGLTLEGCGPNALLVPVATDMSVFGYGMVVLDNAPSITLRHLTFEIATIPAGAADLAVRPSWNVGVLAGASAQVTVEHCNFAMHPASAHAFGAGLFALGACPGLAVRRCGFTATSFKDGTFLFGVAALALPNNTTTNIGDAEISDNLFQKLAGAVGVFADFGVVRCNGNRVEECGMGMLFASRNLSAATDVAQRSLAAGTQANAGLVQSLKAGFQAPVLAGALSIAEEFATRIPPPAPPAPVSNDTLRVLLQDITTRGSAAFSALSEAQTMTQATGAAAVQSAPAVPAAAPTSAAAAPPTNAVSSATTAFLGAAATPAVQNAERAQTSPSAPAASTVADPLVASLLAIQAVSLSAEILGAAQTAALHISGNDITLAAGANPGVGVTTLFSPGDSTCAVLLNANRVTTANAQSAGAALLYPGATVVSGNIFMQGGTDGTDAVPALALLAEKNALVEVMANVVHSKTLVLPPRGTAAATTSWDFLNTVR